MPNFLFKLNWRLFCNYKGKNIIYNKLLLYKNNELYLCLVSDEVNFWFGRLSGCCSGNNNIWLLFRLLHQHVDESLFFILRLHWNNRRSRGWRCRRFNEHYLIVFLWRWHIYRFANSGQFVVRGWYVHINMFVDYGLLLLLRWSVLRCRWTIWGRRRPVWRWRFRTSDNAQSDSRYYQWPQCLKKIFTTI